MKKLIPNKVFYLGLFLTLVMVLYAQFILGYFSEGFHIDGQINSLGLLFGYGVQEVELFVRLRSTIQLKAYLNFLMLWDSVFPLLYTGMYVAWFFFLFGRWRIVFLVPIAHMVFDWIENYLEFGLVSTYLEAGIVLDELVSIASGITMIKWTLSILTYSILIYGIIYKIRITRLNRNENKDLSNSFSKKKSRVKK